MKHLGEAIEEVRAFPLIDAVLGRRSRRFLMGAEIPDGHFEYRSKKEAVPLSEEEQLILLASMAGNTGWHHMIMRNGSYAPFLPNYSGAAGGRTMPSAAGFHTMELFYTDDHGVYLFETKDSPDLTGEGLEEYLEAHSTRIRQISGGRLDLPPVEPHTEGHNTWVANMPGSTLVIPVGDLAEHMIAALCYIVQNGICIYDDVNGRRIEGMDEFEGLVDFRSPMPLSFLESLSMAELTAEMSISCYIGTLMLQAMGLGGWIFDGLNPYSVLGASGDPKVRGLGFRFDVDERWSLPNPTGLPGVFEGHCPPHYPDMDMAVEAFAERKFGLEGPFHPNTPGPWRESSNVRSSAMVHDDRFKDCVKLMANYIHETFGKFPGTVPSVYVMPYLQAHHLDLDFYDRFFEPGSYLTTHREHMNKWHSWDR